VSNHLADLKIGAIKTDLKETRREAVACIQLGHGGVQWRFHNGNENFCLYRVEQRSGRL